MTVTVTKDTSFNSPVSAYNSWNKRETYTVEVTPEVMALLREVLGTILKRDPA